MNQVDVGWRVAAILAGILCVLIGMIGTGATFHYGLVKDSTKMVTDLSSVKRDMDISAATVKQLASSVEMLRQTVHEQSRTMDRVATYLCYSQTGKPCPSGMLDERQ